METIWTADHVEQLKRYYADGLSCRMIADAMGCFSSSFDNGRSAVIGKIHRMKLAPPLGKKAAIAKPQRRNPSHNVLAKIASAEAAPGLPDNLKGDAPDGTGIQISDLTAFTCRWPTGDPKTPEFEYCGARPVPGFPYCLKHCRLSYQLST